MKKLFLIPVLLTPIFCFAETPRTSDVVKIEDVVDVVSRENFTVLEKALKVYQAKKSVSVARANLLPKLNLWKAAAAVVDPMSLVDMIQDIAPFLVPSNWFRVSQNKLLLLAEKEGYRALWANEVLTAKALYYQTLLDQKLLTSLNDTLTKARELEGIVKSRERLGFLPPGSSEVVEGRRRAIEADQKEMLVLIGEELKQLSFSLGYEANRRIEIADVSPLPEDSFRQIDPVQFELRTLDVSPELRQYDQLLKVIPYVKKEVYFSFLGASSASRGVAGGIFDHLPTEDGLGFGAGPSIKIISTEKQILTLQKRGIEETMKRNLQAIALRWNTDLDHIDNMNERLAIADRQWRILQGRMNRGEPLDLFLMMDTLESMLGVRAVKHSLEVRFLRTKDRLDRLLFAGDYSKDPADIELVKKGMEQ